MYQIVGKPMPINLIYSSPPRDQWFLSYCFYVENLRVNFGIIMPKKIVLAVMGALISTSKRQKLSPAWPES